MNVGGKQHPVETLVEWLAPLLLAAAVGWASIRLGLSTVAAGALGVVALVAGYAAIRTAGRSATNAGYEFQPVAIEELEPEFGELLLEAKDEILILDDPLVEPAGDSRVVRLFARQQPTPGELVERIEDFLVEVRGASAPAAAAPVERRPVDASAALHAALANVRASLR